MTVAVVENSFTKTIQYWDEQRHVLGYETVWSMWECTDVNQTLFKQDKTYRVVYKFIDPSATIEQLMSNTEQWIEVSMFAPSGSVKHLWFAAESCYQQAKQIGDHHVYIEDFVMREDGSFELVMGS
jgi:hypothetical protein